MPYRDRENKKVRDRENSKRYREIHKDFIKQQKHAWYLKNKEAVKTRVNGRYQILGTSIKLKQRAAKYGISVETLEQMLRDQNGICATCKKEKARLEIDHCHKTGKVRKLLCFKCNVILGLVEENVDTLRELAKYVEFYRREHGHIQSLQNR